MPRRVGYGRPGTKVFPDGWATTQGPVVKGTFDATVTVGKPGTAPTWNPERRQTESAPITPPYTGPASVTPDVETTTQPAIADEQIAQRRYQVELPRAAAGITDGMVVTVTACTGDTDLVGQRLLVVAVEYDPRRFVRVLQAVINS